MLTPDVVALIPVLALAYAVVIGGTALITGWQWFTNRKPPRRRRRSVVPPVGGTELESGRAR